MNSHNLLPASHINIPLATFSDEELIIRRLGELVRDGGKTGTEFQPMPYIDYKPAEVKVTGEKMFIQFSVRHPLTRRWVRVKKYGAGKNMGLNRIGDPTERAKMGRLISKMYNQLLSEGWIPKELRVRQEPSKKTWTMFQALNLWKINTENKADRKATIRTYSSMVNIILKNFGKVTQPLNSITRNDIELFLTSLKKSNNLTGTTYNSYLQFIKVFFNYCVDSELMDKSPAKGLKPIKATVTRHKYFTDEEFEKIKKHAPKPLLEFMQFLYETGLRPKEAKLMQFKHVRNDMLFVPASISKNKSDGYVPLSEEYAKKLQGPPDHYIFGGEKPRGVNYYSRLFASLKELLQLDVNSTLYSIKHTRAVHLIKYKVDPFSIMKLFRHSSLEITMKYLRGLGTEVNREAVERGRPF